MNQKQIDEARFGEFVGGTITVESRGCKKNKLARAYKFDGIIRKMDIHRENGELRITVAWGKGVGDHFPSVYAINLGVAKFDIQVSSRTECVASLKCEGSNETVTLSVRFP